MKNFSVRKKLSAFLAAVLAVCLFACAWLYIAPAISASADNVSTQAEGDQRVQLKDLMDRHGVDYVIGPVVASHYVGNILCNNDYGIRATEYFDYTKYLHITTNSEGKKVLHGWENGINAAESTQNIQTNGTLTGNDNDEVYIYKDAKYVIVLPDDVKIIGTTKSFYYDTYFDYNKYTKPNDTSCTSFSFYWGDTYGNNWCPRERLAGIYCGPQSQLEKIEGVTTDPKDRAETPASNRTAQCNVERPALFACNNMRFCILPSGLAEMGRKAFAYCAQLRDINIPDGITIGNLAFANCSAMPHVTISENVSLGENVFYGTKNLRDVEDHTNYGQTNFPAVMNYYTNEGGSKLYAVGTKDGDTGTQAFYFCYNNIRNEVLATTDGKTAMTDSEGHDVTYKAGWYAIGLAALEDKEKKTIYELPKTIKDNDARRQGIIYDYINPDGTVHKNTLANPIESYDIAANMVQGTWCSNIIIPETVTVIGDNAFNFCHIQYLEIGAGVQNIGYMAFYDNYGKMDISGALSFNNIQYYYIHCKDITKSSQIGSGAFDSGSTGVGTIATERRFIFDNKSLYDDARSLYSSTGITTVSKNYEIPIYAEVKSSADVTVVGDMETVFRHDSDRSYKTVNSGVYTITYTKRLNGYAHDYVKTSKGYWATATSNNKDIASNNLPIIEGYQNTNWYATENPDSIDDKLEDISSVYPGTCKIYSKKVGTPTLNNIQNWTYSETMNSTDNSFNNLLGLSDDYSVQLLSYNDPWNETNASRAYVNAAGTYKLRVQINPLWGTWSEKDAAKYDQTVTVKQKPIDLGDFTNNIPEFWGKGNTVSSQLLGTAEGTNLYEYADGWYTTKMNSAVLLGQDTVSNSYIVYAGENLQLIPKEGWNLYNITGDFSSQLVGLNSGRYNASFTFTVKNSNYIFTYDSYSENSAKFESNKISYTSMLERSAIINKRWYIVKPLNWLIDYNSTVSGADSIDHQYILAERIASGGTSLGTTFDWTYEDTDIRINIPKLANGHSDTDNPLSATITFNGQEIAKDIQVADLRKYLNDAMPAGEYNIVIAAKAVTVGTENYAAFNTAFTITVKPKTVDLSTIKNYLTGNNTEKGNSFEHAYDVEHANDVDKKLFLFDSDKAAWKKVLGDINDLLNVNRSNADPNNNYWAQKEQDKYFGTIALTYNLDSLQTSRYYLFDELEGLPRAPKAVGEYLVYYSISALNYETVGGEADSSRRDYRFTTVIYGEISASAIKTEIDKTNYYYTGSKVEANVPYSANYHYDFIEGDFINVKGTRCVTVTINTPLLYRWTGITDGIIDASTDAKQEVKIPYTILAATNSWQSQPQMTGWSFNGFDKATHNITGTLTYAGAQVYYRLGTRSGTEGNYTYSWIDVGIDVDGLEGKYFTVDGNGCIKGQDVIDKFNTLSVLPAGSYYYLGSYVTAIENVNGFTTKPNQYAQVSVSKATNSWTTSPSMTTWQYQQYSADANFVAGEAKFGTTVTYGIYTSRPTTEEKPTSVNNAFENIADVKTYLEELKAGDYWLVAYVDSGDNYNYLYLSTRFTVIQLANNAWKSFPTISNWVYGQFKEGLFTPGEATYSARVTYKIERQNSTSSDSFTLVATCSNLDDLLAELGTLDVNLLNNDTVVGGYKLTVTTDSTANYAAATRELRFSISRADNTWKIEPSISNWNYGATPSTPSNGSLNNGQSTAASFVSYVYYYTKLENEQLVVDTTRQVAINRNTDAGTYALIVTVAAQGNYNAISHTVLFTIAPIQNQWEVKPESLLSWAYRDAGSYLKDKKIHIAQAEQQDNGIYYTITRTDGTPLGNEYYNVLRVIEEDGKNNIYDLLLTLSASAGGRVQYLVVTTVPGSGNYSGLTAQTYITVSPEAIDWENHISIGEKGYWTYGDTPTVTAASVLAHPELDIVYIINGTQSDNAPVSKTVNNFVDLEKELQKLNAGNYSVTATVSGTEIYNELSETVFFTVNKIATAWKNAEQLESERNLTWTWTVSPNPTPTSASLEVENWVGSQSYTIKYTITDLSDLNNIKSTELSNSYWINAIMQQKPGTYRLTATVNVDLNHEPLSFESTIVLNKLESKWKDASLHENNVLPFTYGNDPTVLHTPVIDKSEIPGYTADRYKDNRNVTYTVLKSGEAKEEPFTGLWSDKLKTLGVGTYIFTATVPADDYRKELSHTTTVTVERANNGWYTVVNEKTYLMAIGSKVTVNGTNITGWRWNTAAADLLWESPIPNNGNSVIFTVSKLTDSNTVEDVVIIKELTYQQKVVNTDEERALKERLRDLPKGKYKITAEIPQDSFFNAYSQSIDFTVELASNGWTTGGEPRCVIENGTISCLASPWYGKDYVTFYFVKATDENGNTINKDSILDSAWSTQMITEPGSYYYKAVVAGDPNYYLELTSEVKDLSIDMQLNNWAVQPGVNGWQWNGFDREVNLFRGSAVNNGQISFIIQAHVKANGLEGDRPLEKSDFTLTFNEATSIVFDKIATNGFTYESVANSVFVSTEIADLLYELKPGEYKLIVNVASDGTFAAFSGSDYFTVSKADNEWIDQKQPNVNSFTYGAASITTITTGEAKYGTSEILYRVNSGSKVVIRYDEFNWDKVKELPVGNYTLYAWIPEVAGATYKNLYTQLAPYPVPFSVFTAPNSWKNDVVDMDNFKSTSIYYTELQDKESIWFTEPDAQEGTVVYQILSTNYSSVDKDVNKTYTHGELLARLKDLESGEYILRISLVGLTNYYSLTADVALSIKSYTTELVNVPDKLQGQWQEGENGENATVINVLEGLSAVYIVNDEEITIDASNIKFKLHSQSIPVSLSDFITAGKSLDAGSYQVEISVIATNVYSGINVTVQLDIAPGSNEWLNDWTADGSLSVVSASRDAQNVASWTYKTAITWTKAQPKYGNLVYVDIKQKDSNSSLYYIAIDYNTGNNGVESARKLVNDALSSLDVGEYTFTVSSPADVGGNWQELSEYTTFKITQASNRWTLEPVIKDYEDKPTVEWKFGETATVKATALFGTVIYEYYKGTTKLSGMPTNAGEYEVRVYVSAPVAPEPANYTAIDPEIIPFEITKAKNEGFLVSLGATGWTWNEYDRMTHLFNGIPQTQGDVRFAILKDNEVVVPDIQLVDLNGEHNGNFETELFVSETKADEIKALLAGKNYTLRIDVAATDNYQGFSVISAPFEIGLAVNVWNEVGVAAWSQGKWTASENTPKAVPKFGTSLITITSKVSKELFFKATYNSETKEYKIDPDHDNLDKTVAGWYVMEATVEAAPGKYTAVKSYSYEFQIFVQGSPDESNYWNVEANIKSWVATTILDDISMPVGSPLRGKPYFVFYERKLNGTKFEVGDPIGAGEKSFTIVSGDTYAQDFYIPKAPGLYYMRAFAVRYDMSGNVVEKDSLKSDYQEFEILWRENSWELEPRMDTLLYLGDRDEWNEPTATALEKGEITYEYKNNDTGVTSKNMPIEEGEYTLIATAYASFCHPLTCEVKFTVELSPNNWISAPSIQGWSEEDEPNEPSAIVLHGTKDDIVYTYINVETGEEREERPTTEGTYILNAVVKLDGYKTLTSQFKFTVAPAFDTDLLIVNIVLGTVAIGMGIAVTYLARKRYKQC